MIVRFVSGLRKDIQDIVELQEYSSLDSLVHLAMKVEAQLAKKNSFKYAPVPTKSSGVMTCLARDYVGRAQRNTWARER